MASLKISSKEFGDRYQEKAKDLLAISRRLSERPTSDEIHDLRVTARRIQVMRRLLPKRLRRSQMSRRFDLLLKSVLKRTSQLRDLDTLTSTLSEYHKSIPNELLTKLENQRSDAAAQAKAVCDLLSDSPPPQVEVDAKGKRLSKRLRKRVRKHSRAAVELLSDVVRDEAKVDELHSLRLEVKKLRYLLELSDRTPPELAVVVRWQESLGVVHDLDVAMGFLGGSEVELKGWAVDLLRRNRHKGYLKFVGEYRADSMGVLEDSSVLVGVHLPQPARTGPPIASRAPAFWQDRESPGRRRRTPPSLAP